MRKNNIGKIFAVISIITLIFSFFQPVSFATSADKNIITDITSLPFVNFGLKSDTNPYGTTENGLITYTTSVYDDTLQKNVVEYSSTAFAESHSLYNTAGREARHFLLGRSSSFKETLYNDNEHKYLNIEFYINIENPTDGLAFRLNRYLTQDDTTALDSTTCYYFAVGGENFSESVVAGSKTTKGYSYIYNGLVTNKWHKVVIQLGADTSTNTIRFFVDDNKKVVTEKTHEYISSSSTQTTVTTPSKDEYTFPQNTSGFGSRGENFSVIIPKGTKGSAFCVKLSDFNIKATNEEIVPKEEEAEPLKAFELNSQMELIRDEENGVSFAEVTAPHFASSYAKKSIHITSGTSGYAVGTGGYTTSNYNTAGKAPGFNLLKNANETIGNIDYSKYKYLRVSFNILVNEETNGVYFRFERVNETAPSSEHGFVFGVGAQSLKIPSSSSTIHTTINKSLSLGRWHNVVIELGAKKGASEINYYIDNTLCEVKSSDTAFADNSNLFGFGGTSLNRCMLVPKANLGSVLDLHLNNFVMLATNEKYSLNQSANMKITNSKSKNIKVEGDAIYSYKPLSDGECSALFDFENADYIGVIENGKYVVLYNQSLDMFKYYDVTTLTDDDILYTEGLHVDDLSTLVLENKTKVKCNAYNLTGDYTKTAHLVISYFKDDTLVECFVKEISFEDKLTFLNEDITRKTDDFDTVRAFVWSDIHDMTILGEYAVQ